MQHSYMDKSSIFLETGCFVVGNILRFMDIARTIKNWVYYYGKLVQIVRVVLGSVYQFWSKTYGSICENLPL